MEWTEADAVRTSWLVFDVVQRVLLDVVKQVLDLVSFLFVAPATLKVLIFTWLETPCYVVYLRLAAELLENLLAQHLL
jgi:hypothetical protein